MIINCAHTLQWITESEDKAAYGNLVAIHLQFGLGIRHVLN